MEVFQGQGGKVKFGPKNGGSCYEPHNDTIIIDGNCKGNATDTVRDLSHELGHATSDVKKDWTTKESFVKSYLSDEGEATLSNLRARKQILDNDGPDIGVCGSSQKEYQKIFDGYLKDKDDNKAREAIGRIFGEKETTSTTQEPYSKYYGDFYDKVIKGKGK